MPRFKLNWSLAAEKIGSTSAPRRLHKHAIAAGAKDGFQAGDIVEANLEEVEQFVARDFGGTLQTRAEAVMTPVNLNGEPLEVEINRDVLQAELGAELERSREADKITAYCAAKDAKVSLGGRYTHCTTEQAIKEMRQQVLDNPKYAPLAP